MNKKLLILSIAIVSVLICMAAVSASDSKDLEIKSLHIAEVKNIHTDSNGDTTKNSDYYVKFNVKSKY